MTYEVFRRPNWWGGVVNLFWHVTAFNQSDYSIDQSNCRTALTCQNKFTTPPHQYGRLCIKWTLNSIYPSENLWKLRLNVHFHKMSYITYRSEQLQHYLNGWISKWIPSHQWKWKLQIRESKKLVGMSFKFGSFNGCKEDTWPTKERFKILLLWYFFNFRIINNLLSY